MRQSFNGREKELLQKCNNNEELLKDLLKLDDVESMLNTFKRELQEYFDSIPTEKLDDQEFKMLRDRKDYMTNEVSIMTNRLHFFLSNY